MPQQRKPDVPGRVCKVCDVPLVRKVYGGVLETYTRYLAREHCSQSCGNTKANPTSRDTYLWRARKHRKPACEECGTAVDLHVHHKDRDRTNNDPSNLRTLCSSCHLKLHWREDRTKRVAAMRRAARVPKTCVVCGTEFTVTQKKRKQQTCGNRSCWNSLLSRRAVARYAKAGAA